MPTQLTIVTPEGRAFEGAVDQVVLPGAEGDFGVLEGHERFLAPLRIGSVEIRSGGGSQWAAVSDGFAEVNAEQVTVLVDACQLAKDVDSAALDAQDHDLRAELSHLAAGDETAVRRAEVESALALIEAKREVVAK